jgi:hypothetical protein
MVTSGRLSTVSDYVGIGVPAEEMPEAVRREARYGSTLPVGPTRGIRLCGGLNLLPDAQPGRRIWESGDARSAANVVQPCCTDAETAAEAAVWPKKNPRWSGGFVPSG